MTKAKILVVEDESIVAMDVQNILNGLGYAVPAIVSSGEEAIEKSAEICPDLVLMDIVLSGAMDGIEAAKVIRTRFHIPVVYLTAHTEEKTFQRAKKTEPYGFILKPFEEAELLTVLEEAIYRHNCLEEQKSVISQIARKLCSGQ